MEIDYDTMIECIDWRYSAAIVGLKRYFDFSNKDYERITDYTENKDSILYHRKDITQERFLSFVEEHFKTDMHHIAVEEILQSSNTYSKEQIDLVNTKLSANTVMKKVFEKLKFDGENEKKILDIIRKNRQQIVMETFRYKKNMYANYCNVNLLFKPCQPHCRLNGYNIDEGRKSKSLSYNFKMDTFVSSDRSEFDFIPFAFSNTYEAVFINNNWNLTELYKANLKFEQRIEEENQEHQINAKNLLFRTIIEVNDFLEYDIEVIVKDRDKDYFETLFIRKKAIDIMQSLGNIRSLIKPQKLTEKYYIDIQKEAMECIVNDRATDRLIESLLKDESIRSFTIFKLIEINYKIKGLDREEGVEKMRAKLFSTKKCAEEVVKKLEKNKLKSYRQKLISAIVSQDYSRFCEILLQLSSYSEISFPFSYELFEDFEKNKDIAYTFVSALNSDFSNSQENVVTQIEK